MNHDKKKTVAKEGSIFQRTIYWTYKNDCQKYIKTWTYYFFNDMIDIKNFDSNLLKIDKKSYKNIDIY